MSTAATKAAAEILPELYARRERVMQLFREYNDGRVTRNNFSLIIQLLGLQVQCPPARPRRPVARTALH